MKSNLRKLVDILNLAIEILEVGDVNRNVIMSVTPKFARDCIAELQNIRDKRNMLHHLLKWNQLAL